MAGDGLFNCSEQQAQAKQMTVTFITSTIVAVGRQVVSFRGSMISLLGVERGSPCQEPLDQDRVLSKID